MADRNWTARELLVLRAFYGKLKARHIATNLPGRTVVAVMLKARELGIKSNRSLTGKRLSVDADFFSTPTVESSYWAGFIAADGSVSAEKNRVRIKLHIRDAAHLQRFRQACRAAVTVVLRPNADRPHALLDVNGVPQWKSDLAGHFRVTPRKTFTLEPPPGLSRENRIAFTTGYIDGDGCITIERPRVGAPRLRIQATGTASMLSWIKALFDEIDPTNTKSSVRPIGKVFEYRIACSKAARVAKVILSVNTPRLRRKWDMAADFARGAA